MTTADVTELHRRMVRIETRLVALIEALGYDKRVVRHSDDESKVVHHINGTKELT